jgi:threonine synthase
MRYLSTRGQIRGIPFKQAVMMGLAEDGGLLLPERIPRLTPGDFAALGSLAYPELAFQVLARFIDDIPSADLKELVDRSYAGFTHPEITPVVRQGDVYILELFHGPTLAFKDVALQLLGNLFEYLLVESGSHMNILGATSGDTGSAAIYGVRGKRGINIFILHPHGKVSAVQELQMTTVTDPNVYNLAIRGTFDDGQRIVKEIFGDLEFKKHHALGAVNSINWARVLAQVVYYVYAWARVSAATAQEQVDVSVPTGNFGDIFAGFIAKRMGLPIRHLVLATNANNILTRFVVDGDYSIGAVHPTLSPSMDIQVASNFERYLYYLYGQDPLRVRTALSDFARTGTLHFSADERRQVAAEFRSQSVDDAAIIDEIRNFHAATGYVLDPHTAVGVRAGRSLASDGVPMICLATAHPAKFPDAVCRAIGRNPDRPASLAGLEERPRRCETIAADTAAVKEFVTRHAL